MDPREVLTRPTEPPDAVVRYADHADGIIDVFLPASLDTPAPPRRLVVLVHGGFWRQQFDRTYLRPLPHALADDGYVVASLEYRRTGGMGGWPQTGEDVLDAIQQSRSLVAGIAPGYIDPTESIVLIGHSAGGHLALWAAPQLDFVADLVALAPAADIEQAARLNLDSGAAQELMDGEPDDLPEAYSDADAVEPLRRWIASPDQTRVLIVHGTADERVPVQLSRELAAAAPAAEYVELPDVEHFALIDPWTSAWREHVRPWLPGPTL